MTNVDARAFGKVAVLMGGKSGEREISLKSGRAVYQALVENNIDAHMIDADENIFETLRAKQFDRAFIALHGCGGEDGTLQGGLGALSFFHGTIIFFISVCFSG